MVQRYNIEAVSSSSGSYVDANEYDDVYDALQEANMVINELERVVAIQEVEMEHYKSIMMKHSYNEALL